MTPWRGDAAARVACPAGYPRGMHTANAQAQRATNDLGDPTGLMTDGTVAPSVDLTNWIADNRHLMNPPVGNKYLYSGKDFFVMVIAGPNARHLKARPHGFKRQLCRAGAPGHLALFDGRGDVTIAEQHAGRIVTQAAEAKDDHKATPSVNGRSTARARWP